MPQSIVTWLFDPQHSLFVFSKSFPSSYVNCNGVFGSPSSSTRVPTPLGLLLFIRPMLPSLHRILKLATHTRHHLYHFHSLATSCMRFLPMNIGQFSSSPTDIFLGIINESYSCSLLILLAKYCPQSLSQVADKIWVKHSYHYDIDFVFLHVIS